MINRLRGILIEKKPPLILLEVGGVGYEINMPITCFDALPKEGEETIILTHLVMRDDAYLLFGFNNLQERVLFQNLIKINNIGPKLALLILSGMSIKQFVNSIEKENLTALIKIPGISKKIAERIIFEMKNHLKRKCEDIFFSATSYEVNNPSFLTQTKKNTAQEEAVSALISLGYKPKDADKMISRIARLGVDSATLICDALRLAL